MKGDRALRIEGYEILARCDRQSVFIRAERREGGVLLYQRTGFIADSAEEKSQIPGIELAVVTICIIKGKLSIANVYIDPPLRHTNWYEGTPQEHIICADCNICGSWYPQRWSWQEWIWNGIWRKLEVMWEIKWEYQRALIRLLENKAPFTLLLYQHDGSHTQLGR